MQLQNCQVSHGIVNKHKILKIQISSKSMLYFQVSHKFHTNSSLHVLNFFWWTLSSNVAVPLEIILHIVQQPRIFG